MTPDIISYTEPKGVDALAGEAVASKTGAIVVYGPYSDLPPSAAPDFVKQYQQPVTVHYKHSQPVLEVTTLKRAVEISHWGANLNTQDQLTLYNAGPK